MKRENMITENLAMGILDTDKKLLFGVLNTANHDGVMGYVFVAGDTPDCLETVGCFPEDIEAADIMTTGRVIYGGWPSDKAVVIIKMKDDRGKSE